MSEFDGDAEDLPEMHDLSEDAERKGLRWSLIAMVVGVIGMLIATATARGLSAWRAADRRALDRFLGADDAFDRRR